MHGVPTRADAGTREPLLSSPVLLKGLHHTGDRSAESPLKGGRGHSHGCAPSRDTELQCVFTERVSWLLFTLQSEGASRPKCGPAPVRLRTLRRRFSLRCADGFRGVDWSWECLAFPDLGSRGHAKHRCRCKVSQSSAALCAQTCLHLRGWPGPAGRPRAGSWHEIPERGDRLPWGGKVRGGHFTIFRHGGGLLRREPPAGCLGFGLFCFALIGEVDLRRLQEAKSMFLQMSQCGEKTR